MVRFVFVALFCLSAHADDALRLKDGRVPPDEGSWILSHAVAGLGVAAGRAMSRFASHAISTKVKAGKPEKLKVVNVCYHTHERKRETVKSPWKPYLLNAACEKIKETLTSKECSKHVDYEEVPPNLTPDQLERALRAKDLPSGTVVLVGGHMAGAGLEDGETIEEWKDRVSKAKDLFLSGANDAKKPVKANAQAVKKAIGEAIVNPAIWVSSCRSGGLCERDVCLGTSCQPMELTGMEPDLGWLDPASAQMLKLLCDPEKRNSADENQDNRVDGNELNEVFTCDYEKYPPTLVFIIREKKKDLVADLKKRAAIRLGNYLLNEPSAFRDPMSQNRATELQRLYPESWRKKHGLTFDKWEQLMDMIRIEKDGEKTYRAHLPAPEMDEGEKARCYWGGSGGMEHFRPRLDHFSLPVEPNHK